MEARVTVKVAVSPSGTKARISRNGFGPKERQGHDEGDGAEEGDLPGREGLDCPRG